MLTNEKAKTLIWQGRFDEAEKFLIQLSPKSIQQWRNQLVNLQMLNLYKKMLGMNHEFERISAECLNSNMGDARSAVIGNIGLSEKGSDGIFLLKKAIFHSPREYTKSVHLTNLAYMTKDVTLVNDSIAKSNCLQTLLSSLVVKAILTANKDLFNDCIWRLHNQGYKADIALLKEMIG